MLHILHSELPCDLWVFLMMFHFCLDNPYSVHCKDLIFSLPSFQKKKNILLTRSTCCVCACVRARACVGVHVCMPSTVFWVWPLARPMCWFFCYHIKLWWLYCFSWEKMRSSSESELSVLLLNGLLLIVQAKEKKTKGGLISRFTSIKKSKSPPPATYSMDNPVFDDGTVAVSPQHPVHVR